MTPSTIAGAPGLQPRERPHYFVSVVLYGGMDHTYTFNALNQDEVGSGVDVGYRGDERVAGRQRLFGPCIGGMLRHEADVAVIHGVRHNTVSHQEGTAILRAGRRHFTQSSPAFIDRVAEKLPGDAPMAVASFFPDGVPQSPWPSFEGVTFDTYALRTALAAPSEKLPRWVEKLSQAQAEQSKLALVSTKPIAENFASNARLARLADEWLAGADRTTKFTDLGNGGIAPALQLALNGIRNNRAKCFSIVTADTVNSFDSHAENDRVQRQRLVPVMNDLAMFVDMLKQERNEFGSLFEQTTILIGSEMGRFPKLNNSFGKDHWPENSWIMLGRGVRGGVVGATDKRYQGVPVSFTTGRLDASDRRPIYVESVFATLARILNGDEKHADYKSDEVLLPVVA